MTDLEKDFVEFISKFERELVYEPKCEEMDDVYSYKYGDYSYAEILSFTDLNKDVRRKDKQFVVRSDDCFYVEARLPYKYRLLKLEFIVKTLWPNREDILLTPDRGSVARKKWEAKRLVDKHEEEGFKYILGSDLRDGIKYKPLSKTIDTKYVRYELLERMPKEHPLYKLVYNFKMKKRMGYIRSSNRYYSTVAYVSTVFKGGPRKLSKKDYDTFKAQKEVIYKAHKESKWADRHAPLAPLEIKWAKEKGELPVYTSEDMKELYEYMYGKENVIIDEEKKEEYWNKHMGLKGFA